MQTIDGANVVIGDLGSKAYGTIEPGSSTFEEQISFTGITQNANGTATLTGVKSVGFIYPYTETTGLAKTHAGSTSFIISNTSAFTASYANKANDETITGNWSVPDPIGSTSIANKEWVLSVVNGGAVSFDQEIVSGTAGENLTAGQIVYLKNDGKWYKASSSATGTCMNVSLGVCYTTANTNIATTVLVSGMIKNQTSLSTGTTYYLQDSAGTIGTSAGTISVDIGEAISATNVLFNPFGATTKVLSSVTNVRTSTTGTNSGVPLSPSSGAPNLDITWLNATTGTTDQSQTTQNGTITFGEQNLTTKHFLVAEKFVAARQSISGVSLYKIADTGTFTGTVKVSLQADSAGSPSGSDLASYTISNAVWLKLNNSAFFTVAFTSEYETLTVGSSYWIVCTPSTTDNSNHPNLGINTAGGYASGALKYNNTTDGWVLVTTSILTFKTIDGVQSKIPRSASTGLLPSLVLPYSLLSLDKTGTTVTGTTNETTVFSKQIEGGFFTANSGIRVRVFGVFISATGSTNSCLFSLKYNGTNFATSSTPAAATTGWATFSFEMEFIILNNNSLSSQNCIATPKNLPKDKGNGTISADQLARQFGAIVTTATTSAIDTSEPGLLEITYTNVGASDSTSYLASIIEKIG